MQNFLSLYRMVVSSASVGAQIEAQPWLIVQCLSYLMVGEFLYAFLLRSLVLQDEEFSIIDLDVPHLAKILLVSRPPSNIGEGSQVIPRPIYPKERRILHPDLYTLQQGCLMSISGRAALLVPCEMSLLLWLMIHD